MKNLRARRNYGIRSTNYFRSVVALGAAGMGLLCAAAAQSQTAPAAAPAPEELQEVVVTGTLIRGATAPVGSTLIAVDQDQLQATVKQVADLKDAINRKPTGNMQNGA